MADPQPGQFGAEIALLPVPSFRLWFNDLPGLFRRRARAVPGPFVLVGRPGLALDAGAHTGRRYEPQMHPPNARPWQLWYLRRSPHKGEYLIISAINGLALDARVKTDQGRNPLMWTPHGEPQQRWRLLPAPDGISFLIQSARTLHVLEIARGAERGAKPFLMDRSDSERQMFLFMMPFRGKLDHH